MTVKDQKTQHEQLLPRDIPPAYYDFSHYVTTERMITYWHQINEILSRAPGEILEIGIGNGIVSAILKRYGIQTTTADINESLHPDEVVGVTELDTRFEQDRFPMALCARVLQHLPFADFPRALDQLRHVTAKHLLLTLPVETMRIYFRFRRTGGRPRTLSIPFPVLAKRILQRAGSQSTDSDSQNFWKINQTRETSMANVRRVIQKPFLIEKAFQVPEDMSHAFFVLRKR